MTDIELGYLAGIIDGEGWLGLAKETERRNHSGVNLKPCLVIGSTTHILLERLIQITSMGRISRKYDYSERKKPMWLLWWSANSMRILLPRLLPHLIIKRKQAELMICFLGITAKGKHPTEEERKKMTAIYDELKSLNKKGR
jgi:hypothetical protein